MNWKKVGIWLFVIAGAFALGVQFGVGIRELVGMAPPFEQVIVSPKGDRCAIFTVDRSGPRITIIQLRLYGHPIGNLESNSEFTEQIYSDDTDASAMMSWHGSWRENGILVLDSGDIGEVTWKSEDGINWVRHPKLD